MRALIVDDEAPARRKLRRLLQAEDDVEIVGEAASGCAAVEAIQRAEPDVVFLDVQIPELDGFQVIEAIGTRAMPRVVFVTAYDEHALRAFEVQALDYLLKPFAPERLRRVVARVRDELARPSADVRRQLEAVIRSVAPATRRLDRLLVRDGDRALLLPVDQIEWVEADRNHVRIHTRNARYLLRRTIGELAAALDARQFLRVHRSQIVRLDAIKELQPWFHGDYRIVLQDGTLLTWSRRYRAKTRGDFGGE